MINIKISLIGWYIAHIFIVALMGFMIKNLIVLVTSYSVIMTSIILTYYLTISKTYPGIAKAMAEQWGKIKKMLNKGRGEFSA